jgi:hypothetical protein
MGGVAKAVGSVISGIGKGVGSVLGSLGGGKKRKTPSPKALMASVPKPDQTAQRLASSASQYGGSTILTGAEGLGETATTKKTLLGG